MEKNYMKNAPSNKNRIIGYCGNYIHRGNMTVTMLKQHNCLNKNCPHFKKVEDHDYWVQEEQLSIQKKNRKILKKLENRNDECGVGNIVFIKVEENHIPTRIIDIGIAGGQAWYTAISKENKKYLFTMDEIGERVLPSSKMINKECEIIKGCA